MQTQYNISPVALAFKSELKYMLEMHFALDDYFDIYFAHHYFHGYKAYNTAELEATYYFHGVDPSLVGSFRVVIPIGIVEFDF